MKESGAEEKCFCGYKKVQSVKGQKFSLPNPKYQVKNKYLVLAENIPPVILNMS